MKASELKEGQVFENENEEWITITSIQGNRIYFTICHHLKDECDIENFPGLWDGFKLV